MDLRDRSGLENAFCSRGFHTCWCPQGHDSGSVFRPLGGLGIGVRRTRRGGKNMFAAYILAFLLVLALGAALCFVGYRFFLVMLPIV